MVPPLILLYTIYYIIRMINDGKSLIKIIEYTRDYKILHILKFVIEYNNHN